MTLIKIKMRRKVLKFNKQDIADLSKDEQKQIIGGAGVTSQNCVNAFNLYYVPTSPTQDTYDNVTMISNCLENGCTYNNVTMISNCLESGCTEVDPTTYNIGTYYC